MNRLLALRHAPTDWNGERLLQGRHDLPLSAAGRDAATAWRLPAFARGWPCFVSPLARARQTAAAMGLAAEVEPALIEMDWGQWVGRRLEALRDELGDALARNEAQGLDFRPAGGESPREVMARLQPWLALRGAAGRDCVAITHKGVLRALLALATGWPLLGRPPARLASGRALLFALAADGTPTLQDAALELAA